MAVSLPAIVSIRELGSQTHVAIQDVEILLELEPHLDEIGEQMFRTPDDTLLLELTRCKLQLRKLMRIATYHEQTAGRLRDNIAVMRVIAVSQLIYFRRKRWV